MKPERLARLESAARAACAGAEPAHDFLHVRRVAASARRIAGAEGADVAVAVTAALLHELFNHPKGHPEAHLSGEVAAARARALLRAEGDPEAFVERVAYAIAVHPFSRGIVPDTLEARVLQDADRLDAIGAIGIARCFATGTALGAAFYDAGDPFGRTGRELDDRRFSVDHFAKKLFKVEERLHTATARAIAAERVETMRAFLGALEREVLVDDLDSNKGGPPAVE